MLEVENPIFITGTGRCGSTIFHQVLSYHHQVVWLSPACDKKPHSPQANRRAMRVLDLRLPIRLVRKLIYPVEAYRFWEYHCPGFSEPCRDLVKEDVTPKTKKNIRRVMSHMLTQKRWRLLVKITGWPRIGFLKEVFPDAKFIHIYRDGRAVANSLLNVFFWSGWRGPANWRWGELTPAQMEKWEKFGQSFVALAGIEWETLMLAHENAKQTISSSDLLEIRYEDLCADPVATFRLAVQFSDLEWSSNFETTVQGFAIKNTNHKWQEHLTAAQQKILNECLGETLMQYGYA